MNKNNKSEKLKKFVCSVWIKRLFVSLYVLLFIIWLVNFKKLYVDGICFAMIVSLFLLQVVWCGLKGAYVEEDKKNTFFDLLEKYKEFSVYTKIFSNFEKKKEFEIVKEELLVMLNEVLADIRMIKGYEYLLPGKEEELLLIMEKISYEICLDDNEYFNVSKYFW